MGNRCIKESRGWKYQELKINDNLDEKTIDKIIDRVINIYTYENLTITESIIKASKEFRLDIKNIESILREKFKNYKIGDTHASSVCDTL